MTNKRSDQTDAAPPEGDLGQTFDPSDVEATRAREQGLGVGQKELNQQRDPTRADNGRP